MRGKKAKAIRKLVLSPSVELLVLIHKVYGERTKKMSHRGVYQAVKKLYKMGLVNV